VFSPSRSSLAYSHVAAAIALFIALDGLAAPAVAPARVSANGPIPRAMESLIARDTVWIGTLGCSGHALRNGRGDVIGVVTAQHCVLLAMQGDRVRGSDARTYEVFAGPITARTGMRSTRLRTVARLDTFLVPAGGEILTHDLVFGVAAGHTSNEVVAGYRKEALTDKQMTGLRVGQRVYFGGYPAYQPKYAPLTPGHQFERQSFVAKVLTLGLLRVPLRSFFVTAVPSLWVSVTDTTDGATSSYGVSGAVGMVRFHRKWCAIGAASAFDDLKGTVALRDAPDQPVGFVPTLGEDEITATLAFAYQLPDTSYEIHAVQSPQEIPGWTPPGQP
jgi:hypothetical protein